jgi:hypothetical protein
MKLLKITAASIAGVALLASGAIATGNVSLRSEGTYMTDGPSYRDVNELTKASHVVAQVKVLSAGKSYVVPFDAPQVVVSAPQTSGQKSQAGATSGIPAVASKTQGLLHTDFTVEVTDAVRGNLKKGQQIVVTQIGGTEDSGALVNTEHDPLLQIGATELMFLRQDAKSGKFFTTGGGEGRFSVQNNGTLAAVDSHSQLARLITGKPASFLTGAAKAAN